MLQRNELFPRNSEEQVSHRGGQIVPHSASSGSLQKMIAEVYWTIRSSLPSLKYLMRTITFSISIIVVTTIVFSSQNWSKVMSLALCLTHKDLSRLLQLLNEVCWKDWEIFITLWWKGLHWMPPCKNEYISSNRVYQMTFVTESWF